MKKETAKNGKFEIYECTYVHKESGLEVVIFEREDKTVNEVLIIANTNSISI